MNQNFKGPNCSSTVRHPLRPGRFGGALFLAALWLTLVTARGAATPPVIRSTDYNGAHSNVVHFELRNWMNTNTPNLTVEAWIYARDLVGHQAIVARSFNTNLYFGLNGNQLRLYRSGGTSVDSTGTLAARRWTHVAATYDGTTARFYINGAAAGSAALANRGNNSTNGLSIGGQRDQNLLGLYAFNGYIDEVRLWSVARSQSQIAANLNLELRSGTGLLAAFASGGDRNDITGQPGVTAGIRVDERASGFGILPANLCVPFTAGALRVDANIDLINEYRGAETIVLRSTTSIIEPDLQAYLMVSTNSTNFHLFVGIPALPQGGTGTGAPLVQLMADVNVSDGTNIALGDWECRLDQEGFQGGNIFSVNPPFFPTPQWLGWGQSTSSWQAATAEAFEFNQNYEFRVHGRHLNYFTNVVGLLVRYFDYVSGIGQWVAPRGAITNLPATFARVDWCDEANSALSLVTLTGTVTNLSTGGGVAGSSVRLYSGDSELSGFLLAQATTDAQGRFSFDGISAPSDRRLTMTYNPPASAVVLNPGIAIGSGESPIAINSFSSVTFLACRSSCTYARMDFRHRTLGPLLISGVTPESVPAPVVVRTSPLKVAGGGTFTVFGSNFHPGLQLFLKGSSCIDDPPSFCDRDFEEAVIRSFSLDGLSLEAEVPTTLEGVATGSRGFQLVMKNIATGPLWNYGPSVTVTPPPWPQLHGFEFANQDDHPSMDEFEACYGESIFIYTPLKIRDPFYGLWAAVYFGWMEGCEGSCYGMAGTARLIQEGTLPVSLFDTPASDGVHGVRFGNGLVGPPCAPGGALCPPWPARWTGFDWFQPYRPLNLWGRITSMAGAQTSAEAITSWLEQLGVPTIVGPRRGFAAGSPVNVLNRVRSAPGQYTLCVQLRDFGGGHCVTPYAVTDGMGLAADALTPVSAPNFSLIKVYDNNWPAQERFIEVDRVNNSYRYQSGALAGDVVHAGPGLFSTPMSIYRGSRHAPDPFFMARYGIDFLRLLTFGAASMTVTNAAGGIAGWNASGLTNTYEGALPFLPAGLVPGVADRFDTTMFFLPATNPPTGVGFVSGGSNHTFYAGLGYGDIAIGFSARDNTAVSNYAYGIITDGGSNEPEYLEGMGFRAGAALKGFSAMISHRDASRQSRVWLLDAGAGATTPDVHFEKDGFRSLKIRNQSAQPMDYRVNLAGYDQKLGVFEFASEPLQQPGNSTIILKPVLGAGRGFVRELDTNNDGVPEATDTLPARGALRASQESGLLALRWRPVTANDTLETTKDIGQPDWSSANANVTTDGADRLAKVPLSNNAQFYRVLPSASNCLSLAAQPPGAKPNPWETGDFKFEALNAAGAMLPQNTILSRSGATGLDVIHTLRIQPLDDCHVIHLDVRQTSGLVIFEAVGPLGTVMARQQLTGAGAAVQRVTLRGFPNRIQFVRVISPNSLCLIVNVCGERLEQPPVGARLTHCESFSNAPAGQFNSPLALGNLLVSRSSGTVVVTPVAGLGGNWLELFGVVEVKFAGPLSPCDRVTARVRDLEGGVTLQAFDVGGALIRTIGPLPASNAPQTVSIDGPGIASVIFNSTSAKVYVQDICCDRAAAP